MVFYKEKHEYYCGIDLHTLTMFIAITDSNGKTVKEVDVPATPEEFDKILKPFKGKIVVGVECIFSWYWVSDWCEENGLKFILGHALYMRAIHQAKTKNDKIDAHKIAGLIRSGMFPLAYAYPKKLRATRDLLRIRMVMVNTRSRLYVHVEIMGHQVNDKYGAISFNHKCNRVGMADRFTESPQKTNCETDLFLMEGYDRAINNIENTLIKDLKKHQPKELHIVKSVPGIGKILGLIIVLEIGDIKRFATVQKFASYCRLVKCAHESAGKRHGYGNSKIGNAYLKWAFSEAAVLLISKSDKAKKFKKRAERKHGKAKAMTLLAHRIGRSIYYMLKNEKVFDEARCFGF